MLFMAGGLVYLNLLYTILAGSLCGMCLFSGRRVRVFMFGTGKLRRSYDESPEAAAELQRTEASLYHLDAIDFGRRMAVERELLGDPAAPTPNVVFDDSGNFIIYATLLGIKVSGMACSFFSSFSLFSVTVSLVSVCLSNLCPVSQMPLPPLSLSAPLSSMPPPYLQSGESAS
jgi:hypothetical protein